MRWCAEHSMVTTGTMIKPPPNRFEQGIRTICDGWYNKQRSTCSVSIDVWTDKKRGSVRRGYAKCAQHHLRFNLAMNFKTKTVYQDFLPSSLLRPLRISLPGLQPSSPWSFASPFTFIGLGMPKHVPSTEEFEKHGHALPSKTPIPTTASFLRRSPDSAHATDHCELTRFAAVQTVSVGALGFVLRSRSSRPRVSGAESCSN